jgi:SpoVK/Ycf46/Vps4 family AAA+-type ATPase
VAGPRAWEPVAALKRQRFFTWEFPAPSYVERKHLWRAELNGDRPIDGDVVDEIAAQFRFTRGEIRNAASVARTLALLGGEAGALGRGELQAACRAESNPRLLSFGRKVRTRDGWDQLVLPAEPKTQLREIVDYLRHHEAVYTEWGFGERHGLSRGTNVLFSGPSGTGKTMAAAIMAGELGLDLYKIDLSTVVSKYIGETEKNLSRVFKEAETSNAMLFFDEADALFGKRSEVKDSHDRYANIEVNYLLQKMEEHEGIVVLATNFSKNVDEAFLRRLHFAVLFPSPERDERWQIWRQVFPAEAPLGRDLDLEFLARRFKITGGNIKNIALGAAFLAQADGAAIGMRHVILATKREFQKMGKICAKADFGDYYELVT